MRQLGARYRGSLQAALERSALGRRLLAFVRLRHAVKVVALRAWSAESPAARRESSLVPIGGSGSTVALTLPPSAVLSSDGTGVSGVSEGVACRAAQRYVRVVPRAHVVGRNGVVLTRRRRFVSENLYGSEPAAQVHGALHGFSRSFVAPRERLGPVFVLLGPYSHNYFHWLNDHLPRVEDFLLWRESGPKEARLLVTRTPFPWQVRSLQLLGLGQEDLVATSETHAVANLAAVSSHPGFPESFLPAAPPRLAWLRTRLLSGLGLEPAEGRRRIYVSRRDSERRRVANELEVERWLEARGFESFVLSELPFDDQVRLFHDAGTVVAAHGAGLANLLFSTHPRVVELMPVDSIRPDFRALTAFVKGTHLALALRGTVDAGLEIDLAGLERALGAEPVSGPPGSVA